MVETRLPDPPPAPAAAMPLAELRARHALAIGEEIPALREAGSAGEAAARIRAFMTAIQAAGAGLCDEAERRTAQSLLDFWAMTLIGSGEAMPQDSVPRRLAPAGKTLEGEGGGESEAPMPGDLSARAASRQAADRSLIRIAALARQWRDMGGRGYLLTGEALSEAERFAGSDVDIRHLVEVSRRAIRRTLWRNILIGVLALGLLATMGGWAYDKVQASRLTASVALDKLASQEREAQQRADLLAAKAARKDETLGRQAAEEKADLAAETARQVQAEAAKVNEANNQLLADRRTSLAKLDAALRLVQSGLEGRLDPAAIPETLRADLSALAPLREVVPPLPAADFAGYDPGFLGFDLRLPRTASPLAGGAPLPYVNFSIAMGADRRMPLYTASMVDRSQLRVLRPAPSSLRPDPRLAPDAQAQGAWFEGAGRDAGHLVTRQEIAWGPAFSPSDEIAARQASDLVDRYTNVVPRRAGPGSRAVAGLEAFVLTEFEKGAARIVVFTGPVWAPGQGAAGLPPRALWKIVVSLRSDGPGQPVSDAFLVDLEAGDAGPAGAFDAERLRVPVAEIERLTGLDFGTVLRASQALDSRQEAAAAEPGEDAVADRVGRIDGPDRGRRRAAVQDLVNRLRAGGASNPERLVIATELAAAFGDTRLVAMSPSGRVNLILTLGEIGSDDWSQPNWAPVLAAVRRAVADLEARARRPVDDGGIAVGTQTLAALDALKARIGWAVPADTDVAFRFAGMTRAGAVAVSDKLKALGWRIDGEDRTGEAAGLNEVRWGSPAARPAARLLAGDLRLLGWTKVTAAPDPDPSLGDNAVEVRISE